MDKKLLKQLVDASYKGTLIDAETLETIAGKLNRKQLKAYIRALKTRERELTVTVTVPDNSIKIDDLKKVFQGKNITYHEDSSLLLGLKIQDNDMIYDMTLKSRFESLLSHLDE